MTRSPVSLRFAGTGHALRRSLATTLIARADDSRGGDALVWRRGFHADHEQVGREGTSVDAGGRLRQGQAPNTAGWQGKNLASGRRGQPCHVRARTSSVDGSRAVTHGHADLGLTCDPAGQKRTRTNLIRKRSEVQVLSGPPRSTACLPHFDRLDSCSDSRSDGNGAAYPASKSPLSLVIASRRLVSSAAV